MNEIAYEKVETESPFQPKDIDRLMWEGYEVNLKQYLVNGWHIFMTDIGSFMIYAILFLAINIFLEMIPFFGQIAAPILMFPLSVGFFVFAAKKMKRQPARFQDFLKGFDYLIPLVIVGALVTVLIVLGLFLFIIPGVYLAVGYLFASLLVVDRKMTPWQAMEASRKLITKKWLHMFALALILLIINLAGALIFIVGLIPATAISFCILTAAYDDIVGIESADF